MAQVWRERVRRDSASLQREALTGRLLDGLAQAFFDTRAGQVIAEAVGENTRGGWVGKLSQVTFEFAQDCFSQRHCPLFAAFAVQVGSLPWDSIGCLGAGGRAFPTRALPCGRGG